MLYQNQILTFDCHSIPLLARNNEVLADFKIFSDESFQSNTNPKEEEKVEEEESKQQAVPTALDVTVDPAKQLSWRTAQYADEDKVYNIIPLSDIGEHRLHPCHLLLASTVF